MLIPGIFPPPTTNSVEKSQLLAAESSTGEAMTTYMFFEDALQTFVHAYLLSAVLLIAASGIGLIVIETIERTGDIKSHSDNSI